MRASACRRLHRNPGAHPLPLDGVGHEDCEVALVRQDLGDALSAEGDVEDVEFEEGALWKSGFACQGSENGGVPVTAKIRPGAVLPWCHDALLPSGRPSCFQPVDGPVLWGQHPDELAVMTFNIRYDNPGDPITWEQRKETVFGAVGGSICLGSRRRCPTRSRPSQRPCHITISTAWAGGWRTRREVLSHFLAALALQRVHADTLWLSPAPREAGSIGCDAVLPRIATVVVLHDKQTGKVFRIINTHFSHVGEVAREASAQMLSMRMAGSSADVNLLLGDLNAEPGSAALTALTGGRMADAYSAADKRCRDRIGTFTGSDLEAERSAHIDHILVDGEGPVVLHRGKDPRRILHVRSPSCLHRADAMTAREVIAFWGGPVGFLLALLLLPGGEVHQGALAGTALWMLWWWIGGAVPLGPTSLLPLALFPSFGVLDLTATAAPFGSRFIWLFLGGFVLALALERHGLHRRFALHLLHRLGGGPRRTLLGFMLATALLSMWISNTATTLMMLPMATAVWRCWRSGVASKWGPA